MTSEQESKKLEQEWEELVNFHWDPSRLGPPMPAAKPLKGIWYNYVNKHKETWSERVGRMLLSMEGTVKQCSMCHLGRQMCTEPRGNREITFDPHVFSNRKPSKWMVIGQNPGVNECLDNEPFVGEAGQFFNYHLEANGLERNDFYISNTVKCLRYNSRVKLADGSLRRISHLVREKYSGEVFCVVDGKLSTRRVIGWHKSPVGNREVYKLSYRYSARSGRKDARGIFLTGDHQVMTLDGYKRVDLLDSGDIINTGTPAPNETLESIIIGTLLGDSSISKSRLNCSHSIKQKEWLLAKMKALSCFGVHYSEGMSGDGSGKLFRHCRMSVNACPYFRALKAIWYPKNKKVVPYIHRLTEVMMAVWYMDDGCLLNSRPNVPKIEISMNSFDEENVDRMIMMLNRDFSITATKRNHIGWRLRMNTENSAIFFELISPYIVPQMRYKLPNYMRDDYQLLSIYNTNQSLGFYDFPVVQKKTNKDKSFYCIDVEEAHNFVTLGGVVHNCHTLKNKKPDYEEVQSCKPILMMELGLIKPKAVVTLGAVAFGIFCPGKSLSDNMGKIIKSDEFKVNVFPIYHPSPLNMRDQSRKSQFENDIKLLCRLVLAHRAKHA